LDDRRTGRQHKPSREKYLKINVPKDALAHTRCHGKKTSAYAEVHELEEYPRFPWIQRSELGPDDFHFEKASPWMNQVPVPVYRDSQAMRWFFHGSGPVRNPSSENEAG
jgi:hypothetical protein